MRRNNVAGGGVVGGMKLVLRFFFSLAFFVLGTAGILRAQNTWTGSVSTDWNTAGNWSFGVPVATDEVVIPDVTNDPVISTATALAFSIQVHNGAMLTIAVAGNLTINTTASDALWNMGTVENNGIITIGNLSGSSTYGINNESIFNNNAGGQINIDSTSIMAIMNTGSFSNTGNITLGANNSPGGAGLQNSGLFTNNTDGLIKIDRTTGAAFINDAGTFYNFGNITIGANYECQSGMANLGTFENAAAGQIVIDRVGSIGILNNSGTFTNAGNIDLGGIAYAGFYGLFNMSTFENVAGSRLNIDSVVLSGIYNGNGSTFNNFSLINLGTNFTIGNDGINNEGDFDNAGQISIERVGTGIQTVQNTFNNSGNITIGVLSNVMYMVSSGGGGILNNNTNGVIKGVGSISSINVVDAGGVLSPGGSTGKIVFDTDKDFASSKLLMELNGTGIPGTDFDVVEVQGAAIMGGDLIISTPGFTPSPGQSFVILTASSVTGTFASVTWPVGVTGTVTYGATTVTLNVLTVLPLTLVDFSGNATGNKTALQWKTADEVNTAAFEIERSDNGINYTTIGTVKAIGHSANSYTTIDEAPVTGINYYRLKMKDLDGQFKISRVITVKHEAKDGLQLAPVPAIGYVTVQLKDQTLLNQRAQVYNSIGYVVTEVILTNGARINMTGWPAGMYTLKTKTASYQFVKQ